MPTPPTIVQQDRQLWRYFSWILGLLLLAAGLRFYRLGHQELRGDEGFSWNYVTHEAGPLELVARIIREGDPQPPIHYWLLQGWVQLLGDSEFAMRSLSALLSLLLIPLMYRLGQRIGDRQLGLLAAALTTIHPYQVWLAQDVRNMYQLALIGLLVATLQLPGLVRGARRPWMIYVLAGVLAMYSHYYTLFGLLAHGAYVALAPASRRGKLAWMTAGLAIALAVLPWAMVILPVYAGGQLADPTVYPLLDYLAETLSAAALGPTAYLRIGLLGVLWFGLLIGLGGSWLDQRQRLPWAGLLLAWPLIALAGIYAVTLTRATLNAFYFLMAFPAVYLLAAVGLRAAWERGAGWFAFTGLVTLLMFGMVLGDLYFDARWSKSRGLREAAALMQAEARPGDVFLANFPDPATVYYLRDLDMPYHLQPPGPDFDPDSVRADLDQLAADHARLWHIPVEAARWDANLFVEQHLAGTYFSAASYDFNKVRLRLFAAGADALPAYRALDAALAQQITLLGAYVTVNGLPDNPAPLPGDWLRVTLLWQAAAPVTGDYTVFVHAAGPDGIPRGQHDSAPGNGGAPTSGWQPGAPVLDVHEFQLPPEGEAVDLVVLVGLYDPASGERLPVLGGGDSVAVWP